MHINTSNDVFILTERSGDSRASCAIMIARSPTLDHYFRMTECSGLIWLKRSATGDAVKIMGMEPPAKLFSMELLARRLLGVCSLSEVERSLLLEAKQQPRSYCAGAVVANSQSLWNWPKLIVSGWAGRERIMANGRRQLLSILLPGDLIGNCGEQRALDLVEVIAISNLQLISVTGLVRVVEEDPTHYGGIAKGLLAMRFLEERRLLDQIVRLGAQPAVQRIAGFILELFQRCRAIGFVSGGSFVMPLTQEMVGEALGLSVVHVNRVIRRFKADHLIDLHSGIFTIQDAAGLAVVAGFEHPDAISASPDRVSDLNLAA